MEFKIGSCNVVISPLFAVMICLILLIDATGVMLFGLFAVAIHEIGHLVFMLITRKHIEKIVFQIGGIMIKSRGFSGYNSELLIAMGGCLFNFISFVITAGLLCNNYDEILLIFSAANFGLMIFNLLPINGLDGLDLIKIQLLKKYRPDKVKTICNAISLVVLVISIFVCLYSVLNFGINPTIFVCLLYLIILTLIGLKN